MPRERHYQHCSNILVAANTSKVTRDSNIFADTDSAAEAAVTISETHLTGGLVVHNASTVSWSLTNLSSWEGGAYSGYGNAYFSVSLDVTSSWTLTEDTTLTDFTNVDTALSSTDSGGHTTYDDSGLSSNMWLEGRSKKLNGGEI
ncbi:hypothetical protein BDV10DRAFT_189009 [Aspergillus recurvatus]